MLIQNACTKGGHNVSVLITRFLWGCLAVTSLIAGVIGLLLPVVPQVPFFILALIALNRLSPRFHQWLTRFGWYRLALRHLVKHPRLTRWLGIPTATAKTAKQPTE